MQEEEGEKEEEEEDNITFNPRFVFVFFSTTTRRPAGCVKLVQNYSCAPFLILNSGMLVLSQILKLCYCVYKKKKQQRLE